MRVNNIKYIVEQKFRLRQLQRLYTIQADLLFSFLIKKKKKGGGSALSQGAI